MNDADNNGKSSISAARSPAEIGEFWDSHSLGEVWEDTEPAQFVVDIRSNAVYFPLEAGLSKTILDIAQQRGIPAEILLNEWVKEKAAEILTVGAAE